MTATIVQDAQNAGIQLELVAGKVNIKGTPETVAQWRDRLRESKAEIIAQLSQAANDPVTDTAQADQTGTRRPPGLSPKLLAASKALDQKILDAGLSLTPPEQPKPKLAASNAQPSAPTPAKAQLVKYVDQDWKPLALAYHQHHFSCAVCIAAGRGTQYGPRCGVGAALWTGYQSAIK